MQPSGRQPAYCGTLNFLQDLTRRTLELFPQLERARLLRAWAGLCAAKPMAQMLTLADATVTVCHSRTQDLPSACRQAEILIAAVGRPGLIGADCVRPGAIVIDVGINRTEGGRIGDVDFDAVLPVASAITPVPGGVGPMTIACLPTEHLGGGTLNW